MKFSIVTPTLNQGQYIEQTIDSVLSQKGVDLEYIIIDGGSSDNTLELIKKYEKYLKYWVSEPDRGHSNAVNKGLLHSTGEIFNWLNSDDYYEPDALMRVAEAFQANPSALVVGGRERAFNHTDNRTVEIYDGTNISKPIEQLIYEGIIDQPPTFFKKSVVDQLGFLPEELHYTMDAYWWTKYLLLYGKDNVVKIPNILTNFRLHEDSKTVSKQHLFESDRFAIRKALYEVLNCPLFLLTFFEKNKTRIEESFFRDEKLKLHNNKQRLIDYAVLQSLIYNYKEGNETDSTAAVDYLKYRLFKNKVFIPYFLKLRLIPSFLLRILRQV